MMNLVMQLQVYQIKVFRNEVFVETLSAQQNTWQDDVSISGKVDYVFEKNKTPVGYRTTLSNLDESTWPGLQNYAKRITAVLKW